MKGTRGASSPSAQAQRRPARAAVKSPVRPLVTALLLAILATCAIPLAGAEVAPEPLDLAALGSPTFTSFTVRDGVPDTAILTAAADATGFVWLGSFQGLSRYDGHRWEPAPIPGIAGKVVNLYLDHDGILWGALDGAGLARLSGGVWRIEGEESGLTSGNILRVVEIPRASGTLEKWALSATAGLFLRVGERWQPDPGNAQLPSFAINGIARTQTIGGRERLWVGTSDEGLWYREGGGGWIQVREAGFEAAQVDDLVVTHYRGREELWIATYGFGLFRLTADGIETVEPPGGGPEAKIIYRMVASQFSGEGRTLWAGTRGGLLRVRGGKVHLFDIRHGLPSNAVRGVSVWNSPEGQAIVWAATESGVARTVLGGQKWRIASLIGSSANGVFGVLVEPDGRGGERLWVASNGDGIGLYEGGRWRTFGEADGSLPSSSTRMIARVPEAGGGSALYTSVAPGELIRIREGPRFERVPTPWPKGTGQWVLDLLAREVGGIRELWFATRQSGIYRLRGGEWQAFRAPGAAGRWRAVQFQEQVDADGRSWLWASTNQGLARFDGTGWVYFGREAGLPDVDIWGLTLIPDPQGRQVLWAGSARASIIRVDVTDPLRPVVLPASDLPRPPDRNAYSAQRDSRGRIYIATDNGVQLLEPDPSGGYRETVFSRRDGLVNEECNANAQFIDAHDRYWVGSLGGLSVYDPAAQAPNPRPKPFLLKRVTADNAEVDPKDLKIPSKTRELIVQVALLAWQREEESRFRWQLVGYDPVPGDWVAAHEHVYGGLPPGHYVLRVEARDFAGLESPAIELPIEVVPAWWQWLWLRIAAVASLPLLAAAFFLYRQRWLSRRKDELEREVALRTAELAEANATLTELSRTDALTGLANRRRFDQRLEEEFRRAQRTGTPLALLMLDIDHFKNYNDTLGHPAGDLCLRTVAETIAGAHNRAGELAARYGGEELAVILPGASLKEALGAAENIRQRIAGLRLPHPTSGVAPFVTASLGVAWCMPPVGDSPERLLAAADAALYRAKHDGRNCVRAAEPDPTEG